MNITIIGTGSFGTSLSMILDSNNHHVLMYGRNKSTVQEINKDHTNKNYLKDITLSETIIATDDLKDAIKHGDILILAVPVKAVRTVSKQINDYLNELDKQVLICHVAKGLELGTHKRVSEIIIEEIDEKNYTDVAILSGPSHAEEIALKQPTTVSTASINKTGQKQIQDVFINKYFRVYENNDLIGVEVGGALKNIIALGIGILDGLGFGDNTKSAVITRGLHEIARLGTKMGANPLTFMGLTGVGDLIVTAMSEHSRNFRCGKMLASGQSLDDIVENMGMVVEGVNTTKAAYELAKIHDVDMPITNVLYEYLFESISETDALISLMMRERKSETEGLLEIMRNHLEAEK